MNEICCAVGVFKQYVRVCMRAVQSAMSKAMSGVDQVVRVMQSWRDASRKKGIQRSRSVRGKNSEAIG